MVRKGGLQLALLAAQLSLAAAFIPDATPTSSYATAATLLWARADSCPSNTFQCSEDLGAQFSGICCQSGQSCALDNNNNPACCPSGAVCTGTAPASATGTATALASYVSNQYFSFPYAPTSYDDRDSCSSAVSDCSENYDSCVTFLQDGGQFGVTIAVPGGGGTTVAGGGTVTGASATSICSSLSSQACSRAEATPCSEYPSAAPLAGKPSLLLAGLGIAVTMFNLIA